MEEEMEEKRKRKRTRKKEDGKSPVQPITEMRNITP